MHNHPFGRWLAFIAAVVLVGLAIAFTSVPPRLKLIAAVSAAIGFGKLYARHLEKS